MCVCVFVYVCVYTDEKYNFNTEFVFYLTLNVKIILDYSQWWRLLIRIRTDSKIRGVSPLLRSHIHTLNVLLLLRHKMAHDIEYSIRISNTCHYVHTLHRSKWNCLTNCCNFIFFINFIHNENIWASKLC